MKRIISIAIILIVMATVLCSCGQQPQGIGEAGICLEEFEQLSMGTEYKKVNDLIGGKGELISESKDEDDDYITHVSVYRYEGESGGYAELEFTQKVSKNIYDHLSSSDESLRVRLTSKTKYDLQ